MPKLKAPSPEQIAQNLSKSPDGVTADLGLTMVIAYRVLAAFAVIPGVSGLRSEYGERYLTADTAVFSWLLVAFCSGATALADQAGSQVQSYLGHADTSGGWPMWAGLLFLAFYTLMLWLRFGGVLLRRVNDDFSVHSYSDGKPWNLWYSITRIVPWSLQDGLVRCGIEPLVVLIVGVVISAITGSRMLGFLAVITALGFFLQQVLLQREARSLLLDTVDAEIKAAQFRADRMRLLEGGAEDRNFAPPRARSALSSLDIRHLNAARAIAQQPTAGSPLPGGQAGIAPAE